MPRFKFQLNPDGSPVLPPIPTSAELRCKAADLLSQPGVSWGQEAFLVVSPDNPEHIRVCAVGAMREALGFHALMPIDPMRIDLSRDQVASYIDACIKAYWDAADDVIEALGLPSAKRPGHFGAVYDLPGWNDAPGRTKEEVIEALRKGLDCE